jgi:hypothetical protein
MQLEVMGDAQAVAARAAAIIAENARGLPGAWPLSHGRERRSHSVDYASDACGGRSSLGCGARLSG